MNNPDFHWVHDIGQFIIQDISFGYDVLYQSNAIVGFEPIKIFNFELVHSDEVSTFTCPICKITYQEFIQLSCHQSHSICEDCFRNYYIKYNINKCCICRQKFVLKNC